MGRIDPLEVRRLCPVKFTMPTGEIVTHNLIDEAAADCVEDGADYRNLIQLLRHGGTGGEHVRMAYDPAQLAAELGSLTVPPPLPPPTQEQAPAD